MGHRFKSYTVCIVVPSERQCATNLVTLAESQQKNIVRRRQSWFDIFSYVLSWSHCLKIER